MKATFSLLTLLMLVTIVALGVAVYMSNSKLQTTESELENLIQATGYIDIKDKDLVYVRELPKQSIMSFPYMVAIPEDKAFTLKVGIGTPGNLQTILSQPLSGPQEGNPMLGEQQLVSVFATATEFGWELGLITSSTFRREFYMRDQYAADWLFGLSNGGVVNRSPHTLYEVRSGDSDSAITLYSIDENDRKIRMSMDRSIRNAPPFKNPKTFKIWLEPLAN